MPELPEVETVARGLRRAGLVGRRIGPVRVHWPRFIAGCAPRRFAAGLTGRKILAIGRRGKFIVFRLAGGGFLLVHLRMTGQFALKPTGAPRERHEHLVLGLSDGRELRYRDTRKFGRWRLTRHPGRVLDRLGPEPLDPALRFPEFAARLAAHNRQLKPLLLDQAFLAGLGNIYTDEALWEARLHPRRKADGLQRSEARALFTAIRKVLRRGILHAGTSLGAGQSNFSGLEGRRGRNQDYLRVYGQNGKPCRRCRTPIRRLTIGQRSTHICPQCQV